MELKAPLHPVPRSLPPHSTPHSTPSHQPGTWPEEALEGGKGAGRGVNLLFFLQQSPILTSWLAV